MKSPKEFKAIGGNCAELSHEELDQANKKIAELTGHEIYIVNGGGSELVCPKGRTRVGTSYDECERCKYFIFGNAFSECSFLNQRAIGQK